MAIQAGLKEDLNGSKVQKAGLKLHKKPGLYDEALHQRFLLWKDHSGNSEARIAAMINRSTALVSQYINLKYEGDIAGIETDIVNLLRREEDFEFTAVPEAFCATLNAKLIWEVLQFCDEYCEMGVAVGPSGSGKTVTCNEYKRMNRNSILLTADLTRRSIYAVLQMIAKKIGGTMRPGTNSVMLDAIVDRLKHSNRLLIIDDAHFLRWENFEIIRKIHDCAGVGIAYVGQERLYDQMKGSSARAYLFDQIFGRLTIKRDDLRIQRDDVKMIVDAIQPGLNKECIDFLFIKAREKKKYRNVTKLLKVAERMHRDFNQPMDLELLKAAYKFLLKAE